MTHSHPPKDKANHHYPPKSLPDDPVALYYALKIRLEGAYQNTRHGFVSGRDQRLVKYEEALQALAQASVHPLVLIDVAWKAGCKLDPSQLRILDRAGVPCPPDLRP